MTRTRSAQLTHNHLHYSGGHKAVFWGLAGARCPGDAWRELVEAGYALGDRLLYLREPPFRGDDVLALQVKLNLLGFNAGAERGVYDEHVERAVLDFQQNAGLPLDGLVGESTLLKLEALRKAESGREGKKIPERDGGHVAARSLAGQSIVLPGVVGALISAVDACGAILGRAELVGRIARETE
jgi:hypothetical protein